jgi:hypothetical protein
MKTATPDIGQLKIMVRTHTEISQAVCVLCGQPSLAGRTGTGLYDDGVHMGDICRLCLRGGKRGASVRTRSHLSDLRRLAEQSRAVPQNARADQYYDWLYRYAKFLEDLAGRLENMDEWIPRPR